MALQGMAPERIFELALCEPVIKLMLEEWRCGRVTWDQALTWMVVELAREKESLLGRAIPGIQIGPKQAAEKQENRACEGWGKLPSGPIDPRVTVWAAGGGRAGAEGNRNFSEGRGVMSGASPSMSVEVISEMTATERARRSRPILENIAAISLPDPSKEEEAGPWGESPAEQTAPVPMGQCDGCQKEFPADDLASVANPYRRVKYCPECQSTPAM